jgi:cytochrome c biogenesis protein CcmG, thiol:disulfide interchange protein DsbE
VNRYITGAIGALVVIAAAVMFYNSRINESSIVKSPGHIASLDQMEKVGVPSFSAAKLLEDGQFSLESARGKIVLINFWASWCNPCVQEFPSMLKLMEKYKNELVLVAVSNDESKEEASRFIGTLGVQGENVILVWDPERKVADQYGVQRIPESFLVGRDGKLIRKIVGVEDWAIPESFRFFDSLIVVKK